MKDYKWLIGALILGFAFFIAVLIKKPIGVSTQFSVASGMVHKLVDPDVITEDPTRDSGYRSANKYYDKDDGKLAKSISKPLNYDFIFVLAIPLGAFLAKYLLERKRKPVQVPKKELKETFNFHKFVRTYSKSFLAGFIILFGARMAGGCTSGHMMSGIMQGSVSGLIFAVSVFIVAIPVSIFVYKQSIKEGVNA